jgi:lipoprotein-anchoring transpeptidase ErfK/SrfK
MYLCGWRSLRRPDSGAPSICAQLTFVNRLAIRLLFAFVGIVGLSGCGTVNDLVTSNIPTHHRGRASVAVSLRGQEATLYRGRNEVTTARVSTGREGYGTPTGRFHVIRKDIDHRSGLYGDYVDAGGRIVRANVDVRRTPKPRGAHFVGAPMPFFLEFKPGYGLHAGHLPGYPASHGCVRLSYWKARQFYNAARIGTPVVVTR